MSVVRLEPYIRTSTVVRFFFLTVVIHYNDKSELPYYRTYLFVIYYFQIVLIIGLSRPAT